MRIILFPPTSGIPAWPSCIRLLIPLNSASGTAPLANPETALWRGRTTKSVSSHLSPAPVSSSVLSQTICYPIHGLAINYIDLYRLRVVNGGSARARPGDALWSFSSSLYWPPASLSRSLFLFHSASLSPTAKWEPKKSWSLTHCAEIHKTRPKA